MTGGGIVLFIFGWATLILGLANIQSYRSTMNFPGYSSILALVQIAVVITNLIVLVGLSKYNHRWLENIATIVLSFIFVFQAGIMVGRGI